MSERFQPLQLGHRRALSRSALRVAGTTGVLLVLYAITPAAGRPGAAAIVKLVIGVLVFLAILVWQLRTITTAVYPRLRAAEALAIAFVMLVLGFSFLYLSLSHGARSSFSQHLDHIGSVYFTLSVITTVGFGDIAARTHAARLLVILQFILDLVLVVGVARLFLGTAKRVSAARSGAEQ